MRRVCVTVLLVAISLMVVGCVPGSRTYKPQSETEKYAFSRADREIYPNDVRADLAAHDSSRVAWSGIVLEATPHTVDSIITLDLLIEHHFYDWIEDFSVQHERIFLSPRGEGLFATTWYLKPDTDLEDVRNSIGDMVIVYGIPTGLRDSIVDLRAFYIRQIAQEWFATDIFDYGRPGDSMRILRVPQ